MKDEIAMSSSKEELQTSISEFRKVLPRFTDPDNIPGIERVLQYLANGRTSSSRDKTADAMEALEDAITAYADVDSDMSDHLSRIHGAAMALSSKLKNTDWFGSYRPTGVSGYTGQGGIPVMLPHV
jgi:hypothetical protein